MLSCRPVHQRVDNHWRRDRSSIFVDRKTTPRFSPRSKFSIQTRSFVIGFVTAWNRVNQIRDSINFDPTAPSLINLHTFVYFAFVRNILIRMNFINQRHRRYLLFPFTVRTCVHDLSTRSLVSNARNTTFKFSFNRERRYCSFFLLPPFPSFCANYTRIERGRNLVFHPGWLRYTKGGGRISIFARIDINWYDEDHPWIPSGDRNRWTRKWTFRAWTRANPYSENETQSNVNYSNGYVARNAISLGVITIRQPFPNPCREFL